MCDPAGFKVAAFSHPQHRARCGKNEPLPQGNSQSARTRVRLDRAVPVPGCFPDAVLTLP